MLGYYVVEPEVAGGWGEGTEFTRIIGQPVIVHKLHYQFDGWLGDALLESTPCYIVTMRLADKIKQARLSGVGFEKVEISKSEQFNDLHPNHDLPEFTWLQIWGEPGVDDFGVTSDFQLVVSEKALGVLKDIGISHALVEPLAR